MIEAYAVADVRAAEEAAMADLPEGELMARASAGLAAVVAARLRERDGVRVVGLVGAGNNGGDALYALAHLARGGLRRGGRPRRDRALRRVGGRARGRRGAGVG